MLWADQKVQPSPSNAGFTILVFFLKMPSDICLFFILDFKQYEHVYLCISKNV